MPTHIVLAFDAYGTLLSTSSIAKQFAEHFGEEKAAVLATTARKYQLEYTWRLNSMETYQPFDEITRNSFRHALAENDLELSNDSLESIMASYNELGAFPDVPDALDELAKQDNLTAVVFSNGTDKMIAGSIKNSPSLGPHSQIFQQFVTVEEPKRFKPHPSVYQHLAQKVGKGKNEMGSMCLVSGNPFDVVGARQSGMHAIWVDREGKGWKDFLRYGQEKGGPTKIVKELGEVLDIVKEWQRDGLPSQ